jgi:hypothetical protein
VQRIRRPLAVATGAMLLVLALGGFRYTGFGDAAGKAAASRATTWLKTQQKADGSFEVANFPGFETSDAILAIAENAQQSATWNKLQARAAVNATKKGSNSVLHAIDDFVDSAPLNAGQAAKIVVLVAGPLGINPKKFNPDGDASANLRTTIDNGRQANGSYGAFNATLYAAIAKRVLGGVPANTLAYIRAAQMTNGGWNFAGDPTGAAADADIDTTGLAIQALVAARVSKTDPDLRQALGFLARRHQASGAFQSFGADDPNSTAVAIFGITAAGYDPASSCWRDTAAPALTGTPYKTPTSWLRLDQQANGRILSPNDGFGINTFATTQAIEALRRTWIPVKALGKQQCS